MTDEKNLEVIGLYEKHLLEIGAKKVRADYNAKPLGDDDINHLLSMIPEMRDFIKAGRREKFFRWLGFIQGVLWKRGDFTLDDLKNHNKP